MQDYHIPCIFTSLERHFVVTHFTKKPIFLVCCMATVQDSRKHCCLPGSFWFTVKPESFVTGTQAKFVKTFVVDLSLDQSHTIQPSNLIDEQCWGWMSCIPAVGLICQESYMYKVTLISQAATIQMTIRCHLRLTSISKLPALTHSVPCVEYPWHTVMVVCEMMVDNGGGVKGKRL